MAGRPRKIDYKKIVSDADDYIAKADPPIVAEYAHMHGITRQYLYELADREKSNGNSEISDTIKKISEAKEIILERKGLSGDYNATMSVFSLKQLGWKDRQEIVDETALAKLDQILEETKHNANTK